MTKTKWMLFAGVVVVVGLVMAGTIALKEEDSRTSVSYTQEPQSLIRDKNGQLTPELLTAFNNLRGAYRQIIDATEQAIDQDLDAIAGSIDASEYVDEITGLNSILKMTDSDYERSSWMIDRLTGLVLNPADVQEIIRQRVGNAQAEARAISQQSLELLNLGHLLHEQMVIQPDCKSLFDTCDCITRRSLEVAQGSPFEMVAGTAVSSVVGWLASSAVESMGSEDSAGTQGLSGVAGLGAGLAADQFTSDMFGTKQELEHYVNTFSRLAVFNLKSNASYGVEWLAALRYVIVNEWDMTERTISEQYYQIPVDELRTALNDPH